MQKYPNFYKNFEILCLRRGEPKSTVLERCGIDKGNNIKWVNGSDPNIRTVAKLAAYFGVDPLELREGSFATFNRHTESEVFSDEEKKLIQAWRMASQKDRNLVELALREYGFHEPPQE